MKYVMNKIRKERKHQAEVIIDDALGDIDIKSQDYEKINKKIEKIQDYINAIKVYTLFAYNFLKA